MKPTDIRAIKILNSLTKPAIAVRVKAETSEGWGAAPSGTSKSSFEVPEFIQDVDLTIELFNNYAKKIIDFKNPDSVGVRAFIVQAFEPKFFYVCPECKKKVGEDSTCATHGSVAPEKRAVMNVVIDDGTESIRAVLFHDNIPLLGFDLEDSEKLTEQKQNILGKEMFFLGDVRNNNYFNNAELIINSVKEINFDELLAKIESN